MKKVFVRTAAASTHTTGVAAAGGPVRLSDSPDEQAKNPPGSTENDWIGFIVDPKEAENPVFNASMNPFQAEIYDIQAPGYKDRRDTKELIPMCRDRTGWVARRPVGPQRESLLSLEHSSNATTGTSRRNPGECHG